MRCGKQLQADNLSRLSLIFFMLDRASFRTRYIYQFSNQPAVEQQLAQAFFADRTGFYVDVGSNDPVLGS